MTISPSKYQQAVYQAVQSGTPAIVVSAVAGSGSEARRFCCTHYVYPAEQMFFVRRTLLPLPLLKVKFDGSVEDLRGKEQAG